MKEIFKYVIVAAEIKRIVGDKLNNLAVVFADFKTDKKEVAIVNKTRGKFVTEVHRSDG